MSTQEKLIDKIRKLMAKAEGTDNQAEADAFMAKANSLLVKHNLSMSSIDVKDNANGITEGEQIAFGEKKEEGTWETYLMAAVSSYNLCESILHKRRKVKGGTITIIGSTENVEIVMYIYAVARDTIRRLSRKAYSTYRKRVVDEHAHLGTEQEMLKAGALSYRMPWIRSYLKGAVAGLIQKLEAAKQAVVEESADMSQQYGLMITGNTEAIEEFKDKAYKDLKESRPTAKAANAHAFSQGRKDGADIQLNKGVDAAKEPENKIA